MMNLILDAGNTSLKIAFFENDELIDFKRVDNKNICKAIQDVLKEREQVEKIICASVSEFDFLELKKEIKNKETLVLSSATPIPFKNLYSTPKTLGVDRIALVAAAVKKFPSRNALIIDAGSCVTYDFVNENAEYLGGGIAPGLQMRYKSLTDYTANLPLLTPKNIENLIGNNTENAMHMGVFNGLTAEINGIVVQFSNKYEQLVVILTGGDANFLSKRLKSSIFVDPNFLLHGLNYILEYSINK